MSASTLTQTLAGLWLDHHVDENETNDVDKSTLAGGILLRVFLWINVVQVGCAAVMWMMERRRRLSGHAARPGSRIEAEAYERLPLDDIESPEPYEGILPRSEEVEDELEAFLAQSNGEVKRGRIFFYLALGFVVFVWLTFLGTAWARLE